MGNTNSTQSNKQAQTTFNQAQGAYNQNYNTLEGLLPGAINTASGQSGAATNTYENAMTSGMGAYNPTAYGAVSGQINQNIQTGGYNPAALSQLQNDIGGDVATGGYNEGQVQQMEAGGLGGVNATNNASLTSGYNNLINTGGISDATATEMRNQAQGEVQGTYSALGQNLARQNAAQGNVAGGETAELARQESNEASSTLNNTNATIGQLRQQGTEAGLQGLGGLSTAEAGLQQGLMGQQASNIETGVGQEANLAASQAAGTLSSTQAASDLATNAAQQTIQAAGGLTNLYASSPGYVNSLVSGILQQQQVTGTISNESSQILAELSKNPTLFQQIMGGLGSAGGLLSGLGDIGVNVGDQPGG